MAKDQKRLTERQRQLLEHVGLYHLTCIDSAHALFYQDQTREAARVALFRLVEAELLYRYEIRNRSFYQLTRKGCRQIGMPSELAKPLQSQAMLERHAVLTFCTLSSPVHQKVPSHELLEAFPHLPQALASNFALQHHFFEEADNQEEVANAPAVVLRRCLVDNGGEASRLAAKCRLLQEEAARGPWKELVDVKAYGFVVLTAYASKKQRLQQLLWHGLSTVPLRIEVVPQMHQLM